MKPKKPSKTFSLSLFSRKNPNPKLFSPLLDPYLAPLFSQPTGVLSSPELRLPPTFSLSSSYYCWYCVVVDVLLFYVLGFLPLFSVHRCCCGAVGHRHHTALSSGSVDCCCFLFLLLLPVLLFFAQWVTNHPNFTFKLSLCFLEVINLGLLKKLIRGWWCE